MPVGSSSATAASAFARASAARRADSRTSQRSMSSSASGTPWARYSASTRSYQSSASGTSPRRAATQPRLWRTWVAASAWPIDSCSSSARRKSRLGGAQRAAVDLQDAAVAEQARLPQRVARAAERGQRPAVALERLVEPARAAAGSARAASASAREPWPSSAGTARSASTSASSIEPCSVSAQERLMRASPAAAQAGRRPRRSRPPAAGARPRASASPSSIAARPSARSAVERASGPRRRRARARPAGARPGRRRRRGGRPLRRARARSSRCPRRPTLARHPARREGCSHVRTPQGAGIPAGSRSTATRRTTFLLRPGQILVGPGDAADVAKVLTGLEAAPSGAPFGVTAFTARRRTPTTRRGGPRRAIAQVRKATADRPQGPAQVAPNHVFVGEAAITMTGEPRVQGGPGSSRPRREAPAGAAARAPSARATARA